MSRILNKLKDISFFNLLWMSVLLSEILTLIIVSLMSMALRELIAYDYLITGAITAFFVSFVVVSLILFFTKELRKTEGTLSSLKKAVETMQLGVTITDLEGKILYTNPAEAEMHGYKIEELIGKNARILAPPHLWSTMTLEQIREMKRFRRERVNLRKDGSDFPVQLMSDIVKNESGHPIGIITTCEDITGRKKAEESLQRAYAELEERVKERTAELRRANEQLQRDIAERKQVEEALRDSEQRYRSLFETAKDVIFLISTEGTFTSLNPAFEVLTGWSCAEWIGKPFAPLVYSDDLQTALNVFQSVMHGETMSCELRILTTSGAYRIGEFVGTPLMKNGKVVGFLGIGRDITDRKKFEEQLRHSQKIDAIGQLAGGIAHDFNNILTAVIGYGHFLLMKMNDNNPLKTYVKQILAASEKATNLTQDLLTFSRKHTIELKPIKLNETVSRVAQLISRIIGEDIQLKTTLTDKDLTVLADSGQIEQILMNLAANARDSMPKGGFLTIRSETAEINEKFIRRHGYGRPGTYAHLAVTDTGLGMDERTRQRIFEPFFTTKEVGKGTGLGLSIVYGIVKQHNGYINCYSEPGKGTTFEIYLPLTRATLANIGSAVDASPIGGTETILLAEDETEVRKITKMGLEEYGYKIIEATDGDDAINKFIENKNNIDLLLLDVIMPKKNGREAYEKIKEIRPDIKVVFTSGYASDFTHKKEIIGQGLDFIKKPLSPTKILSKIREILDR